MIYIFNVVFWKIAKIKATARICAGSIDSAVLVSKTAESRLDLKGSLKRTFKVLGGALVILKEIP